MRQSLGGLVAVLIVAALIASASLYTVDQRQNAIVIQLGELKEIVKEPGLHFKLPFIQNVRYFDIRILTLDTPDANHRPRARRLPFAS